MRLFLPVLIIFAGMNGLPNSADAASWWSEALHWLFAKDCERTSPKLEIEGDICEPIFDEAEFCRPDGLWPKDASKPLERTLAFLYRDDAENGPALMFRVFNQQSNNVEFLTGLKKDVREGRIAATDFEIVQICDEVSYPEGFQSSFFTANFDQVGPSKSIVTTVPTKNEEGILMIWLLASADMSQMELRRIHEQTLDSISFGVIQ